MFGYVKPFKPELKIKDYELFKSYYCGLCHSIKKLYGNLPRMSLNYDMTFLSILLEGLEENKEDFTPFKCAIHPFKNRVKIINSSNLDYSAHMNIALAYYKYIDDKEDDNSIKGHIGSILFKSYLKSYYNEYKDLYLDIFYHLKELNKIENSSPKNIDELSHNFNIITGKILSYSVKDEKTKNLMYNLGYNLGKWIYIIDALDDLEKDMKNQKFNGLNALYNANNVPYDDFRKSILNRVEFLLLSCASTCLDYINMIPLYKNKDLIYNILEFGLMDKTQEILKGVDCNEKSI